MLLSPRQADRTALFYDLVHDNFLGNSFLKDSGCPSSVGISWIVVIFFWDI